MGSSRPATSQKRDSHLPQGTLVAIAGGKDIANPAAVIERLDKARENRVSGRPQPIGLRGGIGISFQKKRRARLNTIRDACRAYITGPLREFLDAQLADATGGVGLIELDEADPDGQTLLVWYPELEPRDGAYVQPAVRIEAGAKSALDSHRPVAIRPYIAEDAVGLDLTTADVTTIDATRTIWDRVVIVHGLRRWYERTVENCIHLQDTVGLSLHPASLLLKRFTAGSKPVRLPPAAF